MERISTLFFHEAFSRIVPGLVFVGFYFNQQIEKAFNKDQNYRNFFLIICIFVAVWLIGYLIDQILWGLCRLIFEKKNQEKLRSIFTWFFTSKKNQNKKLVKNPECDNQIPCKNEAVDGSEHILLYYLKQQGEVAMCRSLFLIFLLTFFKQPNGHLKSIWEACNLNHFCFLNLYTWLGIIGFGAIAFLGYLDKREVREKPQKPLRIKPSSDCANDTNTTD